ncbi:hypothetical protein ACFOG5_12375 [Pedobacter fastidiosus]
MFRGGTNQCIKLQYRGSRLHEPKAEYNLIEYAVSLLPVIRVMQDWALKI